MFSLRDNKPEIPFPNMPDILGGHMEEGETPEKTARRELAEELEHTDTGEPFQPSDIKHFKSYVDERGFGQHIFTCQLKTTPNLHLKEGQRLVFFDRDALYATDFAFNFGPVIREYAETIRTNPHRH